MAAIFHLALVLSALIGLGHCRCRRANWSLSFNRGGLSKCDSMNEYIKGFQRNNNEGASDYISLLEEAECCSRSPPWINSRPQTMYADWWVSLDRNDRWNSCPPGYFLNGLYRTGNGRGWLSNIEEGRCSRPADHPSYYGDCYDQDIVLCFDKNNFCKCNDNYFITGLYRGTCRFLYCLEMLRCCKMANTPVTLNSIDKVKTRIMDTSMYDYAQLADYLGYGWSSGCRAANVGEDFTRNGDTWQAVQSGALHSRCRGDKSDQRLNMAFGDWSFAVKNIRFGKSVVYNLQPEIIDSGIIENDSAFELTDKVERTKTSTRRVTHTTTSSWKNPAELGIQIRYTPFPTGGVGGLTPYTFSYEMSSSTKDNTGNQQTSTFQTTLQKSVPPYSRVRWELLMSKIGITTPYTATIIVKFSVEFQGFLRWAGSADRSRTNYHHQYRSDSSMPTFNYRFGDSNTPFYTALNQQNLTNSLPWLWNDLKNAYPNALTLINNVANENRYEFQLTGKFDDVIGTRIDIKWDDIEPNGRP